VNAKNGTAAEETVKEKAKVFGQQMSVTGFIRKIWFIFFSRN
jgi:hypothetical protein